MTNTAFWLSLTLFLVIAELFTGTIYLLMLACGAVVGALASYVGFTMTGQQTAAALFAIAASLWLWLWRKRANSGPTADHNWAIDIGQNVQVSAWLDDGSTQVHYRGALWQARLETSASAHPHVLGQHTIVAMSGNELRLRPVPSNPPTPQP